MDFHKSLIEILFSSLQQTWPQFQRQQTSRINSLLNFPLKYPPSSTHKFHSGRTRISGDAVPNDIDLILYWDQLRTSGG
ncbi:hypothetical protein CEXT_422881 [Caerostris extrusa]|uniref:Uncharacterized protein n=1 Tax=Caerostris extrusa TaxID=172846 RepID=A0AAV4MS13_CAEEX|nr:hypothetical protein CEXT_422881 [Caerostris extrusa]